MAIEHDHKANIRLPKSDWYAIKAVAKQRSTSGGSIIRVAVLEYLERERQKVESDLQAQLDLSFEMANSDRA